MPKGWHNIWVQVCCNGGAPVLHRTVKTPIGLLDVGPDLMPSPRKAARSAAHIPKARATAMKDYIRYQTLKRALIETPSPGLGVRVTPP
jgi:hypothetical protein